MSSDPFALLGLDRKTATEADIRKAYAERLKVTRPEDDRAAFMALREAFERARQEARRRAEYPDDYEEGDDGNTIYDFEGIENFADHSISGGGKTRDAAARIIEFLAQAPPESRTTPADLKALLTSEKYFDIDTSEALNHSLRHSLCELTYMHHPQSVRRATYPYNSHWSDFWDFSNTRPTDNWPLWMTHEVLSILTEHFQWESNAPHPAQATMQLEWLAQVQRELEWKNVPLAEAIFHRFSFAAKELPASRVNRSLVMIVNSCSNLSEQEKAILSERLMDLFLSETRFNVRALVGNIPGWMNREVFDAVSQRFDWVPTPPKLRRKIDLEIKRLHDLGLKRPKSTPEVVRRAAWLEVVRSEIASDRNSVIQNYKKTYSQYLDKMDGAQSVSTIIWVAFVILFFLVVAAARSQ